PMVSDDAEWQVIFRVDFARDSFVKVGNHSTVFGFTSDLPPVETPVRIEDPVDAARGDGLAPAVRIEDPADAARGDGLVPVAFQPAQVPGEGVGTGTGIGLAVSPAGAPVAGTSVANAAGLLGGAFGGTSSFPGAPGAVGALGTARA